MRNISIYLAAFLSACFFWAQGAGADGDVGRLTVTARDIADMKVNRIEDIFNQMPGVTASSSSVGIHGSYKVRVFLDGTPLNDPASGHGAVNWDHIPVESIERIEVLRDSGGLRYGQDSSGGVVLITSKGLGDWSGKIKVYGGSQDTAHADFNLGAGLGLWGFGFKGGYDRSSGYKVNNDKEKWQSGLKVSYNPGLNRFLLSLRARSTTFSTSITNPCPIIHHQGVISIPG